MSRTFALVAALVVSCNCGVRVGAQENRPPQNAGGLAGGLRAAARTVEQAATAQGISNAAEAELESALQKPTRLDFADTPLTDVVDFLASQFDINIYLDGKGLADAAVDPSAPVTISFRKPVALESALRLILDEFDLAFVIQDEVLKITGKEKADEILTNEVYAVGDLLDPRTRRSSVDPLINTITTSIQPDSWDEYGGSGSITRLGSNLVVSQKRDVQNEIRDLLTKLRTAPPKATEEQAAADEHGNDESTTVVYRLEHASGEETAEAIVQVIAPESWHRGNGEGSISVVPMKELMQTSAETPIDRSWEALVVRQGEGVHEQIEDFLAELGQLRKMRSIVSLGSSGPNAP